MENKANEQFENRCRCCLRVYTFQLNDEWHCFHCSLLMSKTKKEFKQNEVKTSNVSLCIANFGNDGETSVPEPEEISEPEETQMTFLRRTGISENNFPPTVEDCYDDMEVDVEEDMEVDVNQLKIHQFFPKVETSYSLVDLDFQSSDSESDENNNTPMLNLSQFYQQNSNDYLYDDFEEFDTVEAKFEKVTL